MSVLITTPNLNSEPDDFASGEQATLVLHLMSTVPEGENATIAYTIDTGGYTFGSGGQSLSVNAFVAGNGKTVSRTPYTLRGPDGGVNLSVVVTPANPPSTGATRVAVASADIAMVATRSAAFPASSRGAAEKGKKRAAKKSVRTKAKASRKQTGKSRASKSAPRRKGSPPKGRAAKGDKNKKK